MSKRMLIVGLVPATVLTLGTGAIAAPRTAAVSGGPVVIASGLNNPRQLAFGPGDTLFVADAGTGKEGASDQSGGCAEGPEGPECAGNTGDVTLIAHPATATGNTARVVAGGFLSAAEQGSGANATGIDSVAFNRDGQPFGLITYVPPDLLPASVAYQNGKLLTVGPNGHPQIVANIARYSLSHPNVGHEPDSDPYGLAVNDTTEYVTDAANNTLLTVKDGKVRTLTVFHYREGDGSNGSFDSVPTSVTRAHYHGHTALFVAELGSFVPGGSNIYVVDPGTGRILNTYSGFTTLTAIAVDNDGTIYATELLGGDPNNNPPGDLVTVPVSGPRTSTPVPLPGGVAVKNGHVYVSEFSVAPHAGQVVRLS